MPLMMVGEGQKVRLRAVRGGRRLTSRLAAMGLMPGVEIQVLSNPGRGPFLVAVANSRIVLGRGMALSIDVE